MLERRERNYVRKFVRPTLHIPSELASQSASSSRFLNFSTGLASTYCVCVHILVSQSDDLAGS